MDVMTPDHPRWKEFYDRLHGREGCNFKKRKKGDDWTWDCTATTERPHANRILADMGGIDIERSLKFFEEHGGYCDCEILINVERSFNQGKARAKK